MVIALYSIIPFSPPFSKVFFTSIFNTLSPHMMYHMFGREWVSTGSHTLLWVVAKVSLSFTKILMSPVSRNGLLLWVKFDFTSSNKSLLLFVALRKLCRDSAKMNFKSSQNCRGWESRSWGCCSHRGTQGSKVTCMPFSILGLSVYIYFFFISEPVDYKFINTVRMLCF